MRIITHKLSLKSASAQRETGMQAGVWSGAGAFGKTSARVSSTRTRPLGHELCVGEQECVVL